MASRDVVRDPYRKVEKNLVFIKENLDSKDILDYFIQDGIFTSGIAEEVLTFNPNTRENRNRLFLQYLQRSGPRGVDVFLEALDQTRNGFIADRIRNTELTGDDLDIKRVGLRFDSAGSVVRSTLQKLIDKTNNEIGHWKRTDGRLFIPTPPLRRCREILNTEGHVNIIGLSGDGKTTLAYSLLLQSGRLPIIVRTPESWEEIDVDKDRPIIMLDDFLGRFELDKSSKDKWLKNLVNMYACVRSGKLQVVTTCREAIYCHCETELEKYDILKPRSRVRLSTAGCELNSEVKLEMVETYIASELAEPKISICENKLDENLPERRICKESLSEISNTKTNLGFPQCCRVFVTNHQCFCRGVSFFENPTEVLLQEIERMRGSLSEAEMANYCALACVLIYGGLTDDQLCGEDDFKMRDIATACGIAATTPLSRHIRPAIERLQTSYLTYSDGVFTFKHNSLTEAVFTSCFNSHPKLLFEHCHFQLLRNFVTTRGGPEKSSLFCILQTSKYMELFCIRLIREITVNGSKHGRLRDVTSHRVFYDAEFVKMFWAYLNSHPEAKLDVIQSTDMYGESILSVSVHSSAFFVESVGVALGETSPEDEFKKLVKDALHSACQTGNYNVYKLLTSRFDTKPDSQCLCAAVDNGRSEIVADLAKYKHWTRDELSKLLYGACSSGNYAMYTFLTSECAIIPDVTCLEVAVVRGRSEITRDLAQRRHWSRCELSDALGTACFLCHFHSYESLVTCVPSVVTSDVLQSAADGARRFEDYRIVNDLIRLGYKVPGL